MEPGGSTESFYDVLRNCDDYIVQNFEAVYPTLKECFSESTNYSIIIRALQLVSGPCLVLFTLEDLEEKLLKYACPCARRLYIGVVEELENTGESISTSVIMNHLFMCQEVMSHLIKLIENTASLTVIKLADFKSLLTCSSEVLYKSYQHCLNSKDCYGSNLSLITKDLTSFFKKAQDLQNFVLQLLSMTTITSEECDINNLNNVLVFIYKCGIILLNLDLRTMADLWKGYTCVVSKYSQFLRNAHDVSVPLHSLSMNIVENIDNFISGDSNIDHQNAERTIKVLCFALKVIIRITEKFNGSLGNCYNSLLNLMIVLSRAGNPKLDVSSINSDSMKQLANGVDPLLSHLIDDENFYQEFATALKRESTNPEKRFELLFIICFIVKKLTIGNGVTRHIWCSDDDNILSWIFQLLKSSSCELWLDVKLPGVLIPGKAKKMVDFYEYLLINVAPFLLMSTPTEFCIAEKILLQNVLQSNPWCALFAVDLWCILARCADGDLCHHQLKCLAKILLRFENWPVLPEKLYLECLMSRLFPFMTQKHRDSFSVTYPPENFPYLWRLFNVKYLSPPIAMQCKASLTTETMNHLNRFLSNEKFYTSEYIKMEHLILGTNSYGCKSGDLEKVIEKLWKPDFNKMSSNHLYKRYLKSICAATVSTLSTLPSRIILSVLQIMKRSLSKLDPSCQLNYLDILDSFGKIVIPAGNLQLRILNHIALLFYECLTNKNLFVRMRSLEVFSSFVSVTSHTQVITESVRDDKVLQTRIANYVQRKHDIVKKDRKSNYLDKLKSVSFEHTCKVDDFLCLDSDFDEPPPKKIILDKIGGQVSELENAIFRIKSNVTTINKYANILTREQRKELSVIRDSLAKIV